MEETKFRFSYEPKLDRNAIPVILLNLFPLVGVIWMGWKPESVFICYALETIVVGVFNIFKMLTVYHYGLPPAPDETGVTGLAMIPFFVVHYFFFVFVQLSIFFSGDKYGGLLPTLYALMGQRSYSMALGAFVINNGLGFINGFMVSGIYTKRTMAEQMFEPYPRIFVQQLVVIIGGFVFSVTGNGYPVLAVFIGIKVYLDLLLKDFDITDLHSIKKGEVEN